MVFTYTIQVNTRKKEKKEKTHTKKISGITGAPTRCQHQK